MNSNFIQMSSTSLIETYKCVPCDRDVTVTNKENHEKTEFHLKNLRKKDCHKCEIEKEEFLTIYKMNELKYRCSKCLDYKHENDFSKNKCYSRGINYLCIQCNKNYYKSKDKMTNL